MRRNTFSSGHYEGPADQFKKTFSARLDEIIKDQNNSTGVISKVSSLIGFKPKDPIIEKAESLKEKSNQLFQKDPSKGDFTESLYKFLADIYTLSNDLQKIAPDSTVSSFLEVDTVNDLLPTLKKIGYNLSRLQNHMMLVYVQKTAIKDTPTNLEKFFREISYKINRLSKEQSHIKTSRERSSSYAQMPFVNLGKNSISLAPMESSIENKKIEDEAPSSSLSPSTSSVAKNPENVGKDAIQPKTKLEF